MRLKLKKIFLWKRQKSSDSDLNFVLTDIFYTLPEMPLIAYHLIQKERLYPPCQDNRGPILLSSQGKIFPFLNWGNPEKFWKIFQTLNKRDYLTKIFWQQKILNGLLSYWFLDFVYKEYSLSLRKFLSLISCIFPFALVDSINWNSEGIIILVWKF